MEPEEVSGKLATGQRWPICCLRGPEPPQPLGGGAAHTRGAVGLDVDEDRTRKSADPGSTPGRSTMYHGLMAALLTTRELALWTQRDPDEVEADPFAAEVIDKVSQMATFLAAKPEWTLSAGPDQAPFDARMVVLQVAKRCYGNPNQVVREGNVGPIGGDQVLDAAALLLALTESERATLTKYNADGDPDARDDSLFVIQTTRGDEIKASTATLYVSDDQQIGLDMSPDPRPWMIPMFSPGDPGDPILYEE